MIGLTETLVPLGQVPDLTNEAGTPLLPSARRGKKLNVATVWRWAQRGKLETVKVGGVRCTSLEALGRFVGAPKPAGAGDARTREAQIQAAEKRLAARGLT